MLVGATKLDPRVKRTRQLLQRALMELAREKSLEGITVQDIAARAEVNRATFYAHFEDKYALLNYTVRETFQARLDEKLSGKPSLTIENLRLLILTTCEYLGEFIGHCAPVRQFNEHALMFVQVQAHLYETLLTWIKEAGSATPETVAMTTSWAIWGTVFQWSRDGHKRAAAQLVEQILGLLQPGLRDLLPDRVTI